MIEHNVVAEIYYPESDGEPMAETDLHRNWMFRIIDILQQRFEGQQVYVSGNLLLYYVEGDPTKSVAPDALVVKGVAPGLRRTYKVWEEGKAPDVVFETTSDSTRQNDTQRKFELYARLGIREYFLFDPLADYLDPPLQGYRLGDTGYDRIEPDSTGRLSSEELGMFLELSSSGELVFRDQATGQLQLTKAQVEAANRRLAEEQRRVAEDQRLVAEERRNAAETRQKVVESELDQERRDRLAAENQARVLAEELARLRAQMGSTRPDSDSHDRGS